MIERNDASSAAGNPERAADDVIFWGSSGQALVLRGCLGGKRLIALFDNSKKAVSPFNDVPLYYGRSGFERWLLTGPPPERVAFAVAIGGDRGMDRLRIQDYLKGKGLRPLTLRHERAFIAADARIGEGSQILAQAAVCSRAELGRACIVNTGASVDHQCWLGDGVHVGPGAHLAGCVTVGDRSMIAVGAVVLPRVRIGSDSIVGAGAVVTRDVADYTVVVGNPAKLLRRTK